MGSGLLVFWIFGSVALSHRFVFAKCFQGELKDDFPSSVSQWQYPHLVFITNRYSLSCIGSLIWDDFVLTVAECITSHSIAGLEIAINSLDQESCLTRKIAQTFTHPYYPQRNQAIYNIALIKLDKSVPTSLGAIPACLWKENELPVDQSAHAVVSTGLGRKLDSYFYTFDHFNKTEYVTPTAKTKHNNCKPKRSKLIFAMVKQKGKHVPHLVAVSCETSATKTLMPIATLLPWITKVLRQNSTKQYFEFIELDSCSDNHYDIRAYDFNVPNGNPIFDPCEAHFEKSDHQVRIVQTDDKENNNTVCYGALVQRNAVVTLAECVVNLSADELRVAFSDFSMNVRDVVVHPEFGDASDIFVNNIAVLMLEYPVPFFSVSTGWYEDTLASEEMWISGEYKEHMFPNCDPSRNKTFESASVYATVLQNAECLDKLPQLSRQNNNTQHLCLEVKSATALDICNINKGAALVVSNETFNNIYGLNLLQHDCDMSKPIVAVRLSAHQSWLRSVLQPRIIKLRQDLHYHDSCVYPGGVDGYCDEEIRCDDADKLIPPFQTRIYCNHRELICCPRRVAIFEQIQPNAIETELNECEDRYRFLRKSHVFAKTNKTFQSPHLVELGWEYDRFKLFDCLGYLISSRGVVTSASCVKAKFAYPNIVRNVHPTDRIVVPIASVHIYPEYNETDRSHDIALIKLSREDYITVNLFPVCLWQSRFNEQLQQGSLFAVLKEHECRFHSLSQQECKVISKYPTVESEMCIYDPFTRSCSLYYIPALKHSAVKCKLAEDDGESCSSCINPGTPIILKGILDDEIIPVNYLFGIHGDRECDAKEIHFIFRIEAYVYWFVKVLN
uniref:Peptidase S1 domain-containing protein n=1 Tax=Anopheles gambiae TaxID=7165 RepID=A0A2C9H3T9_ANOGA